MRIKNANSLGINSFILNIQGQEACGLLKMKKKDFAVSKYNFIFITSKNDNPVALEFFRKQYV